MTIRVFVSVLLLAVVAAPVPAAAPKPAALPAVDIPVPEVRARQRAHAHRARGSQGAGGGREHLVPRGQQGRTSRPHGFRAPVRTPDVQRLGELQRRLVQGRWKRPAPPSSTARTWLDRTNYFQNVPTSALDMTLWMESDRMGHLLGAIDQKVLDEQRGVVQNEKRQRREPALRQGLRTHHYQHLSGGASVFVGNHRLDGRPQRRLARGREGMVPHLLRRRQRGAGDRRRRHRRGSQAEGREVFRRHPRRTGAAPPAGMDREDDGRHGAPPCRIACRRRASTRCGTSRATGSATSRCST